MVTVASGIERVTAVVENGNEEGSGQRSSDWRTTQFVGLSGDQDPFVLRHCSFNESNYYRQPDWMCMRVTGGEFIPMQSTVSPSPEILYMQPIRSGIAKLTSYFICMQVILNKRPEAKPSYYPAANFGATVMQHRASILRTYFEVIHTAYPLLDPARFVENDAQNELLHAAIYALAAPYCPEAQDISLDDLYSFIYQALPIDTRYPRLEIIEAALLFIQRGTSGNR